MRYWVHRAVFPARDIVAVTSIFQNMKKPRGATASASATTSSQLACRRTNAATRSRSRCAKKLTIVMPSLRLDGLRKAANRIVRSADVAAALEI